MEDDARSVDRLRPTLPSPRHHHNDNDSNNHKTLFELWTAARSSRTAVIMVVALALFTDMILYDVIVPILPAILRRVKQDESLMGLLLGVYAAGLLLFTPVFGVWSDRSGSRRTPMLLGQLGLGLSTLLFIYSRNIVLLMIARFLQGIAAAASWTVGLALLADTFPAQELGWAMGLVFGFNTLGYFVGPLMGGILTRYFSLDTPFYICSVFAAVDFAGRLFVNPKKHSSLVQEGTFNDAQLDHTTRDPDPPMWKMFTCPDVVAVGILMALSAASFAAIETLLALHLERRYKMDSLQISLVMLAFILPSIVFSIVAGFWADIFDHWVLMLVGLIIHAPSSFFLAFTKSLPLFLCIAAYYSATSAIMTAASMPEMGAIVDRMGSASYAKIYAITNIFYASGMLGGPIFAYFFSGENSFRNCLLSVGALMVGFVPFFAIVTRKHSSASSLTRNRSHVRRDSNDLRNERTAKKSNHDHA